MMTPTKLMDQRKLKNVLVIDGADNCAYDCFGASAELFAAIFPGEGQDVEFIEDFLVRNPDGMFDEEFASMWRSRVPKKQVKGIDGVLFYELGHKRKYYPNKRDSDLDAPVSSEMLNNL